MRGTSIDLDDLDLIAQLPRGERLKKLVSVKRLTPVGRGSVERYRVDAIYVSRRREAVDHHRVTPSMLLIS